MKQNRKKRRRYWNQSHTMVLKLNKAYMPIDVCTWEDAVGDCYNDLKIKAEIVDIYDDIFLHSGRSTGSVSNNQINCPAVIRMIDSEITQHDMVKTLRVSRKGLYERDDGKCCYCGTEIKLSEMTVEHVYPESKGGLNTWDNLRACCHDCNHEKGDKMLSELGWTLRKRVGIPTLTEEAPKAIVNKIGARVPHESWKKYIYWSIDTEEKLRGIEC